MTLDEIQRDIQRERMMFERIDMIRRVRLDEAMSFWRRIRLIIANR